jgi:predicted MFS family arabinose efflux permease
MLSLTLPLGIVTATMIRALAGVGQGVIFIGIQSYVLAVSSPAKKTQAAAIIVFGFQGGMISGMATGSLLVAYLQPAGIFVVAAAIGMAMAVYSGFLMPRRAMSTVVDSSFGTVLRRVRDDMRKVARSNEFLKTMFLIGVPAKAVLTGIVTFALPLLLGQAGYRQEEIGQVIMLYAIAVVVTSGYISRRVDRTGDTATMLFWGAMSAASA